MMWFRACAPCGRGRIQGQPCGLRRWRLVRVFLLPNVDWPGERGGMGGVKHSEVMCNIN